MDPKSLRIIGIIDLECGGFYPPDFQEASYKGVGPSVALDDEPDDTESLCEILLEYAHPEAGEENFELPISSKSGFGHNS